MYLILKCQYWYYNSLLDIIPLCGLAWASERARVCVAKEINLHQDIAKRLSESRGDTSAVGQLRQETLFYLLECPVDYTYRRTFIPHIYTLESYAWTQTHIFSYEHRQEIDFHKMCSVCITLGQFRHSIHTCTHEQNCIKTSKHIDICKEYVHTEINKIYNKNRCLYINKPRLLLLSWCKKYNIIVEYLFNKLL